MNESIPTKPHETDASDWRRLDVSNLPADLAAVLQAVHQASGHAAFLVTLARNHAPYDPRLGDDVMRLRDELNDAERKYAAVESELVDPEKEFSYDGLTDCAHAVLIRFVENVVRAMGIPHGEWTNDPSQHWKVMSRQLLAVPSVDGRNVTAAIKREAERTAIKRESESVD